VRQGFFADLAGRFIALLDFKPESPILITARQVIDCKVRDRIGKIVADGWFA
jgi:hypothetical protein